MSYNPMGGQTYTLQSSISSTQTTITLSSFTVPVSGDNVTMALMNTSIAYATISPKTSSSEFISFTGITQNSDGTATLTGVTRGLDKTYPYTENTDFKLPHAGQSTFILSDAPQVFNKYAALANDNIFTGQNEVPVPLDDADIANKGYVDALVNGGTVSNNRIVVAGTAGETITIGQLVYFKEADGYWWKTDADTASTVNNVQLGIAQGGGTAGVAITGGVLTLGLDTNNTGTTGAFAYATNTAGGIGAVGTNPRVIGQYLPSLAGLYFNPNYQSLVTDYAVDSVGTDSYAVTLPEAYDAYFAGMTVKFKAGTANTGACTLNVNGLGAKSIYKAVSSELNTGDILANQVITVIYDGTNFQINSFKNPVIPVVNTYTPSLVGSETTQFDITNPSGTTFRYTWDGTGTDPVINSTTFPVGTGVGISSESLLIANTGVFVVTGSGTNYFEITNASGVAESNKTLLSGALYKYSSLTWTKPSGLLYAKVQAQGAGGGGGGADTDASPGIGAAGSAGGYCEKIISASSLGSTESIFVGCGGTYGDTASTATAGKNGQDTTFGSILTAGGGIGGPTTASYQSAGGTATGGDVNIPGGPSKRVDVNTLVVTQPGDSFLGFGGMVASSVQGEVAGSGYGYGGAGCNENSTTSIGSTRNNGGNGILIITEYYS